MTLKMKSEEPVNERRLERACAYVTDLWFPANPQLVSRIRASLAQPSHQIDCDQLLTDIEGDFSLFLFCIRKVIQLLEAEGVPVPNYHSPVELLREAGVERLKQILNESGDSFSRHFFDGMTDTQRQRLEETVISASAVRTLAPAENIDPGLGYFNALLRQLGHTLIAWNYPGVYQRAHTRVKEGIELDAAISELLGFSPGMLAVALAHQWKFPIQSVLAFDVFENPLESLESEESELEAEATARSVYELCRIGEALARASNPEAYPTARADWEYAQREVTARLGAQGIEKIREAIVETTQHYITAIPHFFRGGALLDPESAIAGVEQAQDFERNPYIQKCRPFLKEKLTTLYTALRRGHSVEQLIRVLSEDIVPSCGFSAFTVYTLDPVAAVLIPQLKLGSPQLRRYEPVPCTVSDHDDLITVGFKSDGPVCGQSRESNGVELIPLASVLGFSQRVGAIYLEIPTIMFRDSEQVHLVHLRALGAAFTDCLQLK